MNAAACGPSTSFSGRRISSCTGPSAPGGGADGPVRGGAPEGGAGGPGGGAGGVSGRGPGRHPLGAGPAPGAAPGGALPGGALKAVGDYLDHPAPRSWMVLLGEGLKARDLGKKPVWSRLQREEAALGFYRLKGGGTLPVADPGGPVPGEDSDPGRGPAAGGSGGGQSLGVEPGVGEAGPVCRAGKGP